MRQQDYLWISTETLGSPNLSCANLRFSCYITSKHGIYAALVSVKFDSADIEDYNASWRDLSPYFTSLHAAAWMGCF